MGAKVFVDERTGRGKEALDLPGAVAVDDTVIPKAKPVEAFEFIAEGFGVTRGQREDGGLHRPPDFGSEGALIVAYLPGHVDFSRQAWRRGRT